MNKKFVSIRNKVTKNAGIVVAILAPVAVAAVVIHKKDKTITEMSEMMDVMDRKLTNMRNAVLHAKETGHEVTFRDSNGIPLFTVSPPNED